MNELSKTETGLLEIIRYHAILFVKWIGKNGFYEQSPGVWTSTKNPFIQVDDLQLFELFQKFTLNN